MPALVETRAACGSIRERKTSCDHDLSNAKPANSGDLDQLTSIGAYRMFRVINVRCCIPQYPKIRPVTPTQLFALWPNRLKNRAKKYFLEAICRRTHRQKAIHLEIIGFFRLIGLKKTSPSIAGDVGFISSGNGRRMSP